MVALTIELEPSEWGFLYRFLGRKIGETLGCELMPVIKVCDAISKNKLAPKTEEKKEEGGTS